MAKPLPPITDNPRTGDLATRSLVGVVLIAISMACVWFGGMAFGALVTLGVLLVYAEWSVMHRIGRAWRSLGLALLGAICGLAILGQFRTASELLLVAALALGLAGRFAAGARWSMTGFLYAALPAAALIWMRQQPDGFEYVLWTLAVVWATDIFAYFAGRNIGGPKLMPKISPKKTWSGLGGGMLGAAFTGGMLAAGLKLAMPTPSLAAAAGAALAVLAQAGDFYESWLKRRVGVKDSGTLLPGHGGVMDRIDGLVPVVIVVAAALWASGQGNAG